MIATISCGSNNLAMTMKAKKTVRVLDVIFLTKKMRGKKFSESREFATAIRRVKPVVRDTILTGKAIPVFVLSDVLLQL